MTSVKPNPEKRNLSRIKCVLPVKLVDINLVQEEFFVECVNISKTGMSIVSNMDNISTPIEVLLDPYNTMLKKADTLQVSAEIKWVKKFHDGKAFYYGLTFINLSPENKNDIDRFVESVADLVASAQSGNGVYVPKNSQLNYNKDFIINKRLKWLSEKTNVEYKNISNFTVDTESMKGNIENCIGAVQVPLAVAGPIKVNGQYAKGDFYIPLSTTEGALAMTYDLGCRVIYKAGGANTKIIKDEVHISPVFKLNSIAEGDEFIDWINNHFEQIKQRAESTTRYGKLLRTECIKMGLKIIVKFIYSTGDAQGLNMINKGTDASCKYIVEQKKIEYYHRANYSGIKKLNMDNIYNGNGKAVVADVTIPKNILRALRVTPEEMVEYYNTCLLASTYAGMIGINAHIANGITAMFIACGQDVADISVSSVGFMSYELTNKGDLYGSLYIPNLFVGTVGGGTKLGGQRQCLDMMGCSGTGSSKKFAELVTATALAGEIAVVSALLNNNYVQAHEKYGRAKRSVI
ncbi:MAG: hypothetical protein A2386_05600 [Elusimicrobia bacterium RIFOXYB1_FULL_48_9]|nr:MAG: hypothetical protein A2386_05600 [Elusimicrobia bacterium RIFOXYB1_FULL_48_9]